MRGSGLGLFADWGVLGAHLLALAEGLDLLAVELDELLLSLLVGQVDGRVEIGGERPLSDDDLEVGRRIDIDVVRVALGLGGEG